jgi:hypothetical protein
MSRDQIQLDQGFASRGIELASHVQFSQKCPEVTGHLFQGPDLKRLSVDGANLVLMKPCRDALPAKNVFADWGFCGVFEDIEANGADELSEDMALEAVPVEAHPGAGDGDGGRLDFRFLSFSGVGPP